MAELQYRRPSSEHPTTTFSILLLCNPEREEGLAARENRSCMKGKCQGEKKVKI